MRLAAQAFPKIDVSEALRQFIENFLEPLMKTSNMLIHRRNMRQSKKLNELLFDNKVALASIFEHFKDPKAGFTIEKAGLMLAKLFDSLIKTIDSAKIKECFVYSLMTIQNEHCNRLKYLSLLAIEFQEFICRVAIVAVNLVDTVEIKVYNLL